MAFVDVTVQMVLAARDERVKRRQAFLQRHQVPVITFTMCIAGPKKVSEGICRAFDEGVARIRRELARMQAPILEAEIRTPDTGCEAMFAVKGDARKLKEAMCCLEEMDDLGRLFDMDVADENDVPMKRSTGRKCLICDQEAFLCARQRAHSVEALLATTESIIQNHFDEKYAKKIGELAQRALLFEAVTTPKPGLVDLRGSGSHKDMDIFSFMAGAAALRSYFEAAVRAGQKGMTPDVLCHLGLEGEENMLRAAGANTHKGAVYALGILCCQAGACGEGAGLDTLLSHAAKMGAYYLEAFVREHPNGDASGARLEAAGGFETVRKIALPAFGEALETGKSMNDAGVWALIHLIAHTEDKNVRRRGGEEALFALQAAAKRCIAKGLCVLDTADIDKVAQAYYVSPGGCADLLAVTYFLHAFAQEK